MNDLDTLFHTVVLLFLPSPSRPPLIPPPSPSPSGTPHAKLLVSMAAVWRRAFAVGGRAVEEGDEVASSERENGKKTAQLPTVRIEYCTS